LGKSAGNFIVLTEIDHKLAEVGDLDFRALILNVFSRWKIVVAGSIAGFLFAVLQLHTANYTYAVQMVVTPVSTSGEDSGGSRLGALGGLASLAGVAVPASQSTSQFRLFVVSLKSRDVANLLAQNHELMTTMFAKEWDQQDHSWKELPVGLLDEGMIGVKKLLGLRIKPWSPPDGTEVQEFINSNIQILQDPKVNYLATIELDSDSPQFAIKFLSLLAHTADENLRRKAILHTTQYINYLTSELSKITVAEHRAALMNSLSQQEQTAMAANSEVPYSADIFDSPSVAPLPISPNAKNTIFMGVLLGTVIGALGALLLHFRAVGFQRTIRTFRNAINL
jgi:hypothetical protein